MAKIRNHILSSELEDALAPLLDDIPDEQLVLYAKNCLPGGFTKPPLIRQRLESIIRGSGSLPPELGSFLLFFLPPGKTVQALTFPAIQELFEVYSVLANRESWLLALLLDDREEVHTFGIAQTKRSVPPPDECDKEFALQRLYEFVEESFLDDVGIPLKPSGQSDKAEEKALLDSLSAAWIETLKQENERLQQTAQRLREELREEKEKGKRKLEEHSNKATQERAGILAERDAAIAESRRLANEISSLGSELSAAKQTIDKAVAQGVREQTCAAVRKWLTEPARSEEELQKAPLSTELIERAEKILDAQARQDRYTGNRVELEKRLNALEAVRQRAGIALASAINPIPELRPLLQELESEILSIQRTLFGAKAQTQLGSQLLGFINAAETWDAVRQCGHLVEELSHHSFIPQAERRGIYDALHRKFSLLEERAKPKEAEVDSGWSLRGVLHRNEDALLLVDGHNVLFGLSDIFQALFEDGAPRRKARQRLVLLAEKLVSRRPNVQARICFDGPDANLQIIRPNVSVEYSGGNGDHRADHLILSRLTLRDLRFIGQRAFVVTDDRQVRREIVSAGAKYVANDVFAVLLADFHCLKT
jgi:hypothetical protein